MGVIGSQEHGDSLRFFGSFDEERDAITPKERE
jgi:hypothetical protein